ncbi:MAG: DUF456 domain-containing protein [Candidatus Kerfeldbacteria bacterium]|nr:DUF456 domain-containing protein [Candidatus Kerfeldbacteria bacterium]
MNLVLITTVLGVLMIVGGFIFILMPVTPAIPTIWGGILIYEEGHRRLGLDHNLLILVSLIAAGTIVLDYTLSREGVKKLRASSWGVLGAVIGGGLGAFIHPIATYLIGPVVGALAFEMLRGRDQVFSYTSGNYTIVAFMGGTVVKLVAALIMTGLFILRLQGKA